MFADPGVSFFHAGDCGQRPRVGSPVARRDNVINITSIKPRRTIQVRHGAGWTCAWSRWRERYITVTTALLAVRVCRGRLPCAPGTSRKSQTLCSTMKMKDSERCWTICFTTSGACAGARTIVSGGHGPHPQPLPPPLPFPASSARSSLHLRRHCPHQLCGGRRLLRGEVLRVLCHRQAGVGASAASAERRSAVACTGGDVRPLPGVGAAPQLCG